MDNKMKILLMYSGVYDIAAENGHDAVSGISCEYFFYGEQGEMVKSKISADGISGMRRGKASLNTDILGKITYVPGIYEGSFEMSIGSNGKPVLKLVDVDFLSKVSITPIEEKGAK